MKVIPETRRVTSITVLVKKYADIDIPNNVEDMEKLIHDHQLGRREMLDDLEFLQNLVSNGSLVTGKYIEM
jgi:hypothetical protein